jgi:ankyrin repeat protein
MQRMRKLNLFVTVLVFAANTFAADPLTERLQRGLFEEEANRNLDAAIKEYQSVVTQADEQRKVVATALFRLGECYRKLGRTNEAAAFYQRITRDFSEQEQLAKLAADFLKPSIATTSAGNSSELVRELQRRAAVLKVESMTARMEFDRLTTLSVEQLARSGAATNNPALAQLEPQLLVTEQKLVTLRQQFGEQHPEVKAATALQKTIQQQYEEALKGMVMSARQRADALAEQLRAVDEELKKAGAASAALPPETAAATDDEEKEVRRIQAMIKDSPDLINARDNTGLTPLHLATSRGQVVVARFLIANRADVNARNSGSAGSGETPLHLAAAQGHKSLVELLLASGADVNANATQTGKGNTPLHRAAEKGYRSVIEVLLANKADINARDGNGETPLYRAVGRGFKAIAELLLAQGADVNAKTLNDTTPLLLAARLPNRDLVELLLAKGATVDASDSSKFTALHLAVANKNLPVIELLLAKKASPNLADQNGTTPLSRAVQDGAVNLLEPLLAGGADPNIGDRHAITPLHWAAMLSGGEESAEVLLKHGASVTNKVSWAPGAQPPKSRSQWIIPQGITPLGLAIGYGQVMTAQLLLDHGAEVETMADYQQANNGYAGPALEVAISKNNQAMVKLLLERKANPNIKVYNGWTPLIQAAGAGQKEMVELLLANGAELNVLAPGGWSPLSAALHHNKPEVAELLRQRGAIEDLARSSSITVARAGTKVTVFEKGTNDLNRFTIFEALAQHYAPGGKPFQFPDFARVQVRSIRSKAGEPGRMIDLDTAFRFTNCAANVVLEWGDLIELPEEDHVVNASWPGLAPTARATLLQCLRKQVQIVVKGQTNRVVLTPPLAENRRGQRGAFALGNLITQFGEEPDPEPVTALNSQRLNDVVRGANVIRSSSDLTRVKVIRSGDERWEKVFDLTNTDKTSDLWLRDGDVIEVPEKP